MHNLLTSIMLGAYLYASILGESGEVLLEGSIEGGPMGGTRPALALYEDLYRYEKGRWTKVKTLDTFAPGLDPARVRPLQSLHINTRWVNETALVETRIVPNQMVSVRPKLDLTYFWCTLIICLMCYQLSTIEKIVISVTFITISKQLRSGNYHGAFWTTLAGKKLLEAL